MALTSCFCCSKVGKYTKERNFQDICLKYTHTFAPTCENYSKFVTEKRFRMLVLRALVVAVRWEARTRLVGCGCLLKFKRQQYHVVSNTLCCLALPFSFVCSCFEKENNILWIKVVVGLDFKINFLKSCKPIISLFVLRYICGGIK